MPRASMASPVVGHTVDTALRIDWGKLIVLLAALGSTTALAVAGVIDGEPVVGLLTLVVGYVAGNGNLAARGKPPSPLVSRVVRPESVAPAPASPVVVEGEQA